MKYSYNPVPKSNSLEISANLLDNNRVSSLNVSESITICFYNARSLVNKLPQFHLLYELRYNMCYSNLALGVHINLIKKSYPLTTLHIAMTVSHITWRWSIGCSQTQYLCYCNIQARPLRSNLSVSICISHSLYAVYIFHPIPAAFISRRRCLAYLILQPYPAVTLESLVTSIYQT